MRKSAVAFDALLIGGLLVAGVLLFPLGLAWVLIQHARGRLP